MLKMALQLKKSKQKPKKSPSPKRGRVNRQHFFLAFDEVGS